MTFGLDNITRKGVKTIVEYDDMRTKLIYKGFEDISKYHAATVPAVYYTEYDKLAKGNELKKNR